MYKWLRCPFGLSCSPYYFAKTMRCVLAYLRLHDVRISVYVDDFIVCAEQSKITDHKDLLIDSLHDLGFLVNHGKSLLVPTQVLEHIGYIISTSIHEHPVISVVPRRLQSLRHDLKRVLNRGHVVSRQLARIAGQCQGGVEGFAPSCGS